MSNPRLEFFRFKLEHKTEDYKTFRDFMVENGKVRKRQQDNTIFASLYKYVMEKPSKDFNKDDSLKKVLTLVGNQKINKHYGERPKVKYPDCIISGVINGGPFGKERILGNLRKKNEVTNIKTNQPVLQYYYIFLYLPLDHNEGFIMVHSDSAEETITQAFRKYVANLFKQGNYKKPTVSVYVPKTFRDEYKNGAVLQSMTFVNTELSDDLEDDNPLKEVAGGYEVRITMTPKGDTKAVIGMMENIRDFFITRRFGTKQISRGLDEFDKCTVSTKNEKTNSSKTFDWNNREKELQPAVYLKGRVPIGNDGVPVFKSLDDYCYKLFKEQILKDIRPDKNAQRVD